MVFLVGSRLESTPEMGRKTQSAGEISSAITGLRALGVRDLTYRMAFLATMVLPASASTSAISIRATAEEEEALMSAIAAQDDASAVDPRTLFPPEDLRVVQEMRNSTPQLYHRMVESVAPSIYGHLEIKAGILLMLFGGVHKVSHNTTPPSPPPTLRAFLR